MTFIREFFSERCMNFALLIFENLRYVIIWLEDHVFTPECGYIVFLSAIIIFMFSYFSLLLAKINAVSNRRLRICIAFLCLILFFISIFLVLEIQYLIISISVIVAYWRYELSKYNEVARKSLSEFTEIFQGEVFSKKDIPKLSSILMILATFSNTYAWTETKAIVNRLLGINYDEELEFQHKTPRYFEEITRISEAINRDNGLKGIVCFLPFIKNLVEDRYYKNWIDLTLELLRIYFDSIFYEFDKCMPFLRKYIELGGDCAFSRERADKNFSDFVRKIGIEDIYRRKQKFFLGPIRKPVHEIEKELMRSEIYLDTEDFFNEYAEEIVRHIRKYLSEKGYRKRQIQRIVRELRNAKMIR
jgi:hypothetical protein